MERTLSTEKLYSLWDDFLFNILLPGFRRSNENPYDAARIELTPQLSQYQFNVNLYPFIYDRVQKFVESRCMKFVLRANCNEERYVSIEKMNAFLDRITTRDTQVLSESMSPLRDAYIETTSDPTTPSVKKLVLDIFRKCIYDRFAPRLRKEAFQAISDDLKIQDDTSLRSYHYLIATMGQYDHEFINTEWNKALHRAIHKKLAKQVPVWIEGSLSEFLENVADIFQGFHKTFFVNHRDLERTVKEHVGNARDQLLFKNNAEQFKKMILDTNNPELLNNLFDRFYSDEPFLKLAANHASGLYSTIIYGGRDTVKYESLNGENIFRNFLSIWFIVHKVIVQKHCNRKALRVALFDPLLPFINLPVSHPETISKVLTDVFDECTPRTTKSTYELHQSSLDHLAAIASLSNYLPAAEFYPEVIRKVLSKILFRFSLSKVTIGLLTSRQNSTDGQSDFTKWLNLMLKDASHWVSYRSEMKHVLQRHQKGTSIDLRVVQDFLWELGNDAGLTLPENLQVVSDRVIREFQSRYSTRKASIHSLAGQMIIRTNFWCYNGNAVRIVLSTGQGCVLTLFTEKTLSLKDLASKALANSDDAMGLSALVAILKSFMNEPKIIRKDPDDTDFRENDVFWLNAEFQPTSDFIGLPLPEFTWEENETITKSALNHLSGLDLERIVRAAIMKLLKQERELEMRQVREMVVDRLGMLYDLNEFNFDEAVTKLEADEYVIVDESIVRYIA